MKIAAIAATTLLAACASTAQEPAEPGIANAERFGPDDRIGALNHVTPEKTAAAAALVAQARPSPSAWSQAATRRPTGRAPTTW